LVQSGHVSLYKPDGSDLFGGGVGWGGGMDNNCWTVFIVEYAILMEVWRKSLVMNLVSGSMYVNRSHFMLGLEGLVLVREVEEVRI
jgi:hypothetical protein